MNGFVRFLTFGRILELYATLWREKKSGIQKPGLSSFSPSFSYLIGNNFWRKRPGLVVKKPLPRTILGVIREGKWGECIGKEVLIYLGKPQRN